MPQFFNNGRTLGTLLIGASGFCALASYLTLSNLNGADSVAATTGTSQQLIEMRREMLGYIKLSVTGILTGGLAIALSWCLNNRRPEQIPNGRPTL